MVKLIDSILGFNISRHYNINYKKKEFLQQHAKMNGLLIQQSLSVNTSHLSWSIDFEFNIVNKNIFKQIIQFQYLRT